MGGNNMIASHFLASAMPNEAIGYTRALPDITSGPEVRQIFKIWTLQKVVRHENKIHPLLILSCQISAMI